MKTPVRILVLLVLCLGFAASVHAQPRTITNGLVVHLTFDNTLADNTGRGNNGTYTSSNSLVQPSPATPTYVDGKLGKAFQYTTALDASLIDYVTLFYPADLIFGTGDWSVSFWINHTNNVGDPAMVSNKNWFSSGNHGWGIFFQNSGNFRVQMTDSGSGGNLGGTRPEVIRDGTWHQIAVTFKAGAPGSRNIYLDGALINSAAHNFTGTVDTDDLVNGLGDPYAVNIGEDGTGGYNDSTANPPPALPTGGDSAVIKSKIDDVGFWRRALTDIEVGAVYNFGQLGTNLYNVPDVLTPIVLTFNPANGATGVTPNDPISIGIIDQATAVNTNTLQLFVDGVQVTPTTLTKVGTNTAVTYTLPYLLAPSTTHTNRLTFKDDASPSPNTITKINVFTISAWTNIYLPAPLYFENFDELPLAVSIPPTIFPTSWSASNCTAPAAASGTWDLHNERSDTYLDWVIIPFSDASNPAFVNNGGSFGGVAGPTVVNCSPVTVLGSNNIALAVSDGRSGSQIQYLFTGDYNLTGQSNIYTVFYSIAAQNQDDIKALEYSIDQGATWLPIVYMINNVRGTNGAANNPDIVINLDGSIDASNTLANLHSDVAFDSCLGDGNYYGFFIGVNSSLWSTLGPYISGRIDDNQTESHRVEKYRLPQADGQSKVRFRFAQAGTDSWDWSIDNFGLYSIPAPPPLLITSITKSGGNVTVNWNGTGGNSCSGLQKRTSLTSGSWADIPGTIGQTSYTQAVTGATTYFRAVRF